MHPVDYEREFMHVLSRWPIYREHHEQLSVKSKGMYTRFLKAFKKMSKISQQLLIEAYLTNKKIEPSKQNAASGYSLFIEYKVVASDSAKKINDLKLGRARHGLKRHYIAISEKESLKE